MNEQELWRKFQEALEKDKKVTVKSSVTLLRKTEEKPLISIPLDKLFELYGNLLLTGFEKDEALLITTSVVRDYEQRTH